LSPMTDHCLVSRTVTQRRSCSGVAWARQCSLTWKRGRN
jgi:hypothetical protein